MASEQKTVEQWAEQLDTPAWALAAAKAQHKWADGEEMTQREYREKVKAVTGLEVR